MSKIKVMLVDDEPFIRQGMRMIIDWESYGYEIAAEAENGMQALEMLDGEEIDLVFVDLKMPRMSGLELIKAAQEREMEIRFIVLTGYADFSYAREALRLAVEDYLLKPIQKEELIGILEKVKEEKEKNRDDNIELVLNHELDIHLSHILLGRYMETDLEIVNQYMPESDEWQYVSFEFEKNADMFRNMAEEERSSLQKQFVMEMRSILKDWKQQVVSNLHEEEQLTGAGVLLIPQMYREQQMEAMEYVTWLQKRMQAKTGWKTQVYVGTADELTEFVCAYAEYLERLRKVESEGVLGQVEEYIRKNYSENISLKSIGEQFYINNVYLGQIFKKKNGITFKEYLNRVRIEKATQLLADTDEKIYAIAEKVGFHNTDYFINKFVQEKGMTPRQYRMKRKKEEN